MSTVSGNCGNIFGLGALSIPIEFIARSGIVTDALTVWPPGETRIQSDASGNFAIELEQGIYQVIFNGKARWLIQVPNDAANYNILQLVTSQTVPTPFPVAPNYAIPDAGTVVKGGVLVDANVANPTVYLKATVDALLAAMALTGNFQGLGNPNGTVVASPGARFFATDTLIDWRKGSGVATATGWV